MRDELLTLLWLQGKLTLSMFRSRRLSDQLRVLGVISRALMLFFSIPIFIAMGAGLAVGLILLSPGAAYELAMIVNVGMLFMWLLLPASYTSQIVERFEMSRLFAHPIHFRSIIVGSTMMSTLTMTGAWTLLLLSGEVVGLAWHRPLALPLIVLGALPTFALLALAGRIMDDFFDLVAGDRRLRALMLGILSLPFVFCWMGQYLVQSVTANYTKLPQIPLLERLTALSQANTPSEFLETLKLSRLLVWLPPGWTTAGMGLAVGRPEEWGSQLLFLIGSLAFVALLLWAHAGITRRLMAGAALRVGTERVRAGTQRLTLPGPPALWALFRKDWIHLRRSPLPRRLIFSALLSIVAMSVPILTDRPARIGEAVPVLIGAFVVSLSSMVINLGLTANYFGAVDRDGFATLAFSALDRRYILLSANLVMLVFTGAIYAVFLTVVALVLRRWIVLPLGLYLGICLQIGGMPAYNLAAIIGPYRTQLKFSTGHRRGNMWGMLAWFVSALPVTALVVLPFLFWKPGLAITMPLGAIYSVGLYILSLEPLAKLLQRHEHQILEAVLVED
jgi:hypothetical protein